MEATWTVKKVATAGAIMGTLIALIFLTALASTVTRQSDNARAWSEADRDPVDLTDNTPYASSAAPIFGLYPLFWAIVGLAVVAGAVIAHTKAF